MKSEKAGKKLIFIPKYRFDDINNQKKALEKEVDILKHIILDLKLDNRNRKNTMVKELNNSIGNLLVKILPEATVYYENVSSDLKKPAFFVICNTSKLVQKNNGIFETELNYRLKFSTDKTNCYEEFYKVSIEMLKRINFIDDIKVTDKSTEIIENNLYFNFKIKVREKMVDEFIPMKKLSTNADYEQ